jgi:hypothetical protein
VCAREDGQHDLRIMPEMAAHVALGSRCAAGRAFSGDLLRRDRSLERARPLGQVAQVRQAVVQELGFVVRSERGEGDSAPITTLRGRMLQRLDSPLGTKAACLGTKAMAGACR